MRASAAGRAVILLMVLTTAVTGVTATAASGATGNDGRAKKVSQWASTAKATSQYGTDSWSARQATGRPNTRQCGDTITAWASAAATTKDRLTLGFATPVVPSSVTVYQSYHPGQVTKVEVIDEKGKATTIYTAAPSQIETCPFALTIPVAGVTKPVSKVRVTVDQTQLNVGWTEIDAVRLVGTR